MVIKLRKGKGRPVERRQFYLSDDKGRIHFELWSPVTIFPDRPKRNKIKGRFIKFLSIRNLQLYYDKISGKGFISIFHGLHPTTRELSCTDIELLHATLHMYYNIIIHKKRFPKIKRNRIPYKEDMIK
jgi:hypothetical protein